LSIGKKEEMQRSTERILTTHSGSLCRPLPLLKLMRDVELNNEPRRRSLEEDDLDAVVTEAVNEVVAEQVRIGVDIPGDGEMGRMGFARYMPHRIGGLERRARESGEYLPEAPPGDMKNFPYYYKHHNKIHRTMYMDPEVDISDLPNVYGGFEAYRVTGPVSYVGQNAIKKETSRLKAALEGTGVTEAFIPCTPPSVSLGRTRDILEHYHNEEAYLFAMADALREEYMAIVDAGFLLQVDYPGIAGRRRVSEDGDKQRWLGVEALNYALRDIPEEKIRLHYCSGSGLEPHSTNPTLRETILPVVLQVKAQAIEIEGASARHEHEWMIWKDIKLPEGKILIPGVIAHNYQVVEHPELVAWRIENYASVLGKENVIAGVDCGFSQHWDSRRTTPDVQWAKLESLVEGARLASKKLWSN
jgi:5-methyltetrahydropteroyltriglutamate--homocysteine methyltransferase